MDKTVKTASDVQLCTEIKWLNTPAWTSDSLNPEAPVFKLEVAAPPISAWDEFDLESQGIDVPLAVPVKLPRYALIRTTRATYARAKIIHESRNEIRVSYITVNRKGARETKTDVIDKRNIRTIRLFVS